MRIEVPIPGAFEQWRDLHLVSGIQKLLVFAAIAGLFYFLTRFARRAILANIEDVNRRHALRKLVTYGYAVLLGMVALALFADSLTGLGAILALLVAGIAVALQDVLKSVVGWLYMSGRGGIEVGSRIEVRGIVGDVIDIGVLKTTLMEVGGGLVHGRQSTGRLVTMPNYHMLSEAVLISYGSSPYVWEEVKVTVTFESDWKRGEEVLQEIGDEIHHEIAADLHQGFRLLERRYAFKPGATTPIVYVSFGPSGVELTLRFLVHTRNRRGTMDRVTRRILTAFTEEPRVRIAYNTYRMFQPEPTPRDGPAGGMK